MVLSYDDTVSHGMRWLLVWKTIKEILKNQVNLPIWYVQKKS